MATPGNFESENKWFENSFFSIQTLFWTESHEAILGYLHIERDLLQTAFIIINLLLPKSDLQILLCLTPDDFTRQRETSWALKG